MVSIWSSGGRPCVFEGFVLFTLHCPRLFRSQPFAAPQLGRQAIETHPANSPNRNVNPRTLKNQRDAAPRFTPPLQFQSPESCRNLCPTRLSAKEGLKASNAVSGNSTLRRHTRLTSVGSSPIVRLPGQTQYSGSDAGGWMPSRDLVRLTRRKFLWGVSALTVISSHLQGASADAVTPFVAGTQVDAFKTAQARCSA